ncbi:glycoside hydrolase family 131 protein [Ceratobasidium sp. AG-Ba]|nr:glycoside hydrolase family 131 protein [Ceratobasidium sp. AG-Ba]
MTSKSEVMIFDRITQLGDEAEKKASASASLKFLTTFLTICLQHAPYKIAKSLLASPFPSSFFFAQVASSLPQHVHFVSFNCCMLCLGAIGALAAPTIVYDGRAPLNYTGASRIRCTTLYVVRGGGKNPSDFVSFSNTPSPTSLWSPNSKDPIEQTVAVKVDNSSVFVPGDDPANSQFGFRRTEILAQNKDTTSMESGTTVFHLSVMKDPSKPLNTSHEYQFSFLETSDGNHVFSMSTGTPFSVPAASPLPGAGANSIRILSRSNKALFTVPFADNCWNNLAVQVNWNGPTLAVFSSQGARPLKAVTAVEPNDGQPLGSAGRGEFHFGVLKACARYT